MKKIDEYESLKTAVENLRLKKNGKVSKTTVKIYRYGLRKFLKFLASNPENPRYDLDSLVAEARQDEKDTRIKITDFFQWLQGNEVEGYKPNPKPISYGSARTTAYAAVRGFFVNNEIAFPRTFAVPPQQESNVEEADASVPLLTISEDNGSVGFERGLVQHFLANLKLRDQSIFLAKLSTSRTAPIYLAAVSLRWGTSVGTATVVGPALPPEDLEMEMEHPYKRYLAFGEAEKTLSKIEMWSHVPPGTDLCFVVGVLAVSKKVTLSRSASHI